MMLKLKRMDLVEGPNSDSCNSRRIIEAEFNKCFIFVVYVHFLNTKTFLKISGFAIDPKGIGIQHLRKKEQ